MAKRLVIDQKCFGCGNCEAWVSGITDHRKAGVMRVTAQEDSEEFRNIEAAVNSCPLEFLKLEEDN